MRYRLPGIQLETDVPLYAFSGFECKEICDLPLVRMEVKQEPFVPGKVLFRAVHSAMHVLKLEDGWLYVPANTGDCALHVSWDYRKLTAYLSVGWRQQVFLLPLVRTALECASAAHGVVSLHSACVTLDGKAVCFTASSGTGKSTRAMSWRSGLGAEIISGDRPSLRLEADGITVCGVPWDGKEQIFQNTQAPLLAICSIRRGDFTRVRKLSPVQARRVLMQQCFIPMWDTDTAAQVMGLISALCRRAEIYRVICGPGEEDARRLAEILYHRRDRIMEVEQDMKIKKGFVLRNTDGEYVVMPTGQNISKFDGAIILNEVAAFIWEKMKDSVSREELLEYVLAEFDAERGQVQRDLDALIEKLRGYGVIEDESV